MLLLVLVLVPARFKVKPRASTNDLAEIERAQQNLKVDALKQQGAETNTHAATEKDIEALKLRLQLMQQEKKIAQLEALSAHDDDGGALRGRRSIHPSMRALSVADLAGRSRKRDRVTTARSTEEEAAEAEEAEAGVPRRKRRRLSPEDRDIRSIAGLCLLFILLLTGRLTPALHRKYLAAVAAGGVAGGVEALAGGLATEGLQAPAAPPRHDHNLRPRTGSGNASPAR